MQIPAGPGDGSEIENQERRGGSRRVVFVTNDIGPIGPTHGGRERCHHKHPAGRQRMTAVIEEVTAVAYATMALAAKAAGWEVFEHVDSVVLATRSVVGDQHTVCIRPGEGMPATRSINDEPTDKTNQTSVILDWLIKSAIRDAEYRGSEGDFTA